jgi:DNA-directed RNA polymerase specialized sigma subunit
MAAVGQRELLLGGEQFVERLRPLLKDKASAKAIPKAERLVGRPPLESLFASISGDKEKRNRKIHEAVRRYGYTQSQVGELVGLHCSTVSRIVKEVEQGS